DAWGVVAFRFDLPGASLGYATDVGSVNSDLLDLMRGVQTLAIESNYCPQMQLASARPEFLKRRIMGGKGHLSNQECAKAVRDIAPARRVALLPLSRQCNTPELARAAHEGASYELVITSQTAPARPVAVVSVAPSNQSALGVATSKAFARNDSSSMSVAASG